MKNYKYLYGPVPSRRLGRSLGIDLILYKYCTYDCIYCQSGKTTNKTTKRGLFVLPEDILKELEEFFKDESVQIDYIALSGSGEPTLNSGIRNIIKGIKEITKIPVAVITNGSLFYLEEVRKDVLGADLILPSLDAVSSNIFEKINKPMNGLSVDVIINGLVELRRIYKGEIWLEILFCKGINDSEDEILRMVEVVEKINPDKIHLNTVVRPPSEKWVKPLTLDEMKKIRKFFGKKASIISEFDKHSSKFPTIEIEGEILRILDRRPLSLIDISKITGISKDNLEDIIERMINEKKIKKKDFENSIYYEIQRK